VLLFGGDDGVNEGETWVFDLDANIWTQQSPLAAPSARDGHVMASPAQDQVLLFGGWDTDYNAETWLASGFYGGTTYRLYLPLVMRSD